MRVLVCGSRTLSDRNAIEIGVGGAYGLARSGGGPMTLIHGAAHGADALAALIAQSMTYVQIEPYPADWDRYGKAAGPIRNQRMLDEGKPDLVLAFIDKPLSESRGTADMVRRARKAGVPVYVVEATP